MATKTTTTDDPIYIPSLDELDRLAGVDRMTDLDPHARLEARLAAHKIITTQREVVAQQEVRS